MTVDHSFADGVCVRCGRRSQDSSDRLFDLYQRGVTSLSSILSLLDVRSPHPDGCDASVVQEVMDS